MPLPDRRIATVWPLPGGLRFPEVRPLHQRLCCLQGGRTKQVQMVRHEDIASYQPAIGRPPASTSVACAAASARILFRCFVITVTTRMTGALNSSCTGWCAGCFRPSDTDMLWGIILGDRDFGGMIVVSSRRNGLEGTTCCHPKNSGTGRSPSLQP